MAGYSRFYVFIEGVDDERFVGAVIAPKLAERYDAVQIVQHSGLKPSKLDGFLRSIEGMNSESLRAEYLYFADINGVTSITAKKARIKEQWPRIDEDKIVVVRREIESWYLAGLDQASCVQLGVRHLVSTDEVTKEQFNRWMPSRFRSRIDFMAEILKAFSVPTAREKNASFHYLADLIDL